MTISVSEVLEDAFAEWFENDEFESRDDFEDAIDRFVDSITEEAASVGRRICKMTTEELNDWCGVNIKDATNEEDYE